MNLLLVEDDIRIYEMLGRGLRAEGHTVRIVNDGEAGLAAARSADWDAIILDLMLPKVDGLEVCRTLRMARNQTPILMLTALDSTEDVVRGLRMGADDYLTKPFVFDELLARLETIQRRAGRDGGARPDGLLRVADLTFDRDALVVIRHGKEIELTSLEYALLEFLMLEQGKVVSRSRILRNVWGVHDDPLTNVVDVYIGRLRAKIDDRDGAKLITTIRGRGYRLAVP